MEFGSTMSEGIEKRLENIKGQGFHTHPERINKKGSGKNRKTLLKKWLSVTETIENPITKEVQELKQLDIVVLSLVKEARKGNTKAIEMILDGLYGKLTDKIQHGIDETVTPPIKWLD